MEYKKNEWFSCSWFSSVCVRPVQGVIPLDQRQSSVVFAVNRQQRLLSKLVNCLHHVVESSHPRLTEVLALALARKKVRQSQDNFNFVLSGGGTHKNVAKSAAQLFYLLVCHQVEINCKDENV